MRLLLSVLFLSLMFASPVAAGPPRFVTETDVDPPWTGCAFAAGAMWLGVARGRMGAPLSGPATGALADGGEPGLEPTERGDDR
jgi:hypothetical protein